MQLGKRAGVTRGTVTWPSLVVVLLVAACDDASVRSVADLGGRPDAADSGTTIDATPPIDGADEDALSSEAGPVDAGIDGAREAAVVDANADAGPFVPSTPVSPAEAGVAAPPSVGSLTDLAAETVAAASPPMLLEPCPPTWRRVAPVAPGDPFAMCEPWPGTGAETGCDPGSMHRPGGSGCAPVGNVCPAGDWPDASAIVGTRRYVRAGAPPGGDGSSEATPLPRIADALAIPRSGRLVIVLAAGTYAETVALGADDVVLVGPCASRARIAGAAGGPSVSVTVGTAPVELRDVTVAGLVAARGAPVTLSGVFVDGSAIDDGAALLVSGGSLAANGLHVVGGPSGIALRAGVTAAMDDVVIESTGGPGIELRGDATSLVLSRAAIRDGAGAGIQNGVPTGAGGRVEVNQLVVERATGRGLGAAGGAAVIEGVDVIVRDTRAIGTTGGEGLVVELGARIALDRALFERNRGVGVDCADGSLLLRGAVVRDTEQRLGRTDGIGVRVSLGCSAVIERAYVTRSSAAGIRVESDDTTLDASDVVVRDVRATSSDPVSPALDVRGGVVDGRALVLEGGVGRTVRVLTDPADAAPSTVSLHDVVIGGPSAGAGGAAPAAMEVALGRVVVERAVVRSASGDGFAATDEPPGGTGASLVLSDARLEGGGMGIRSGIRAEGVGVVVDVHRVTSIGFETGITSRAGATAHTEDLVIEGRWGVRAIDFSIVELRRAYVSGYVTAAVLSANLESHIIGTDLSVGAPADGADPGAGVVAVLGASIVLDRVRVDEARGLGVGSYGVRSSVLLSDATITGTRPDATGASASAGGYNGGVVALQRFALDSSASCGVHVADDGGADLDDGAVRDHPIGACLSAGGFDDGRVTGDVLYVDNDVPLSRDPQPLPSEPSRGP